MRRPRILAPSCNRVSGDLRIAWETIEGASEYAVWMEGLDDGEEHRWNGLTTNEFTPPPLPSGRYHLWVRAQGRVGDGVGEQPSQTVVSNRKFVRLMTDKAYAELLRDPEKFSAMVPSGRLPLPPAIRTPAEGDILSHQVKVTWQHVPKGTCEYDVIISVSDPPRQIASLRDVAGKSAMIAVPSDFEGPAKATVIAKYRNHPAIGTRRLSSTSVEFAVLKNHDRARGERERSHEILVRRSDSKNAAFLARAAEMTFEENLALKREEIAERRTVLESFPTLLGVQLGTLCNIDCVFCDNGRLPRAKNLPDSFLEELPSYLPFAETMSIDGGEPLLYKQFRELAEMAVDYPNVSLLTNTNGQLIDESWVKLFTNGRFRQVMISLDAGLPKTYSALRRGGSLEKIVNATREIVAQRREPASPIVTWIFIVNTFNYKEIVEFAKLAADCGVDKIRYKSLIVFNGPYFDNVDVMDFLDDPDVCKVVLQELNRAEEICLENGMIFYEQVYTPVLRRFPELATTWRHLRHVAPSDRDAVALRLERAGLPDLSTGDNSARETGIPTSAAASIGLADDPSSWAPQPIRANLCSAPYCDLWLSGVMWARACCFGKPSVVPIKYEPYWRHIHDVWNCDQMQYMREMMYQSKFESICQDRCPVLPALIEGAGS